MELQIFWATGFTLLVWATFFSVFSGVGLLVSAPFRKKSFNAENWLMSFWVGWASTIFLLQIGQIFLKVDYRLLTIVSLIGAVGLTLGRADLAQFMKKLPKHYFVLFVFLAASLLTANRALQAERLSDSGLYYLNYVRWVAEYPVVPGLGNLHIRLALNSPYFLYVALLGTLPYSPGHFANGLLILVFFAQVLLSIRRVLAKQGAGRADVFCGFCLFPAVTLFFSDAVPSLSPDLPVFILGFVVSAQLLRLIEAHRFDQSNEHVLFSIVVVALAGVLVRYGFFVFGAASLYWGVYAYRQKSEVGRIRIRWMPKWLTAIAAIAILPAVYRNIVLTGYPFFPVTYGALPVIWQVPQSVVSDYTNWVMSWARTPGPHWSTVLGNWDWIKPWIIRTSGNSDVVYPMILTFAALILIAMQHFKKRILGKTVESAIVFIPPLLSLICWFFVAPDPRFAGASFWVIGLLALTLAVYLSRHLKKIFAVYITICLLYAASQIFVDDGGLIPALNDKGLEGALKQLRWNLVPAGYDSGFHRTEPVGLKHYVTNSGLAVYVPAEGDGCFDSPLPCTPEPNPALNLLNGNDLGGGFYVQTKNASGS
ncbi:Uncharacterised protein [uncultured archaeon]|nr:Uncharacterised protein [uncultured archaeon]